MKRIKTVNGYAIYQAMTQRDADNYGCEIGHFNLYHSCDVREYGIAYSYADFEDVETLAMALELANGSNFAVATALADELSDSTVQDMDLALEIERRLDAGQTVAYITEVYDTDEQCFTDIHIEAEEETEKTEESTEEPKETPIEGLERYGLIRANKSNFKIDTALTAWGKAMLKLWGLQNTTKTKMTMVFELDSGQIVARYTGTDSGFPKVEIAPNDKIPEVIRRGMVEEDLRTIGAKWREQQHDQG